MKPRILSILTYIFLFVLFGIFVVFNPVWAAFPLELKYPPRMSDLPPDSINLYELPDVELPGNPTTEDEIIDSLRSNYINQHTVLGWLPLSPNYFIDIPASSSRPEMVSVHFQQLHNGVPIEGSFVDCALKRLTNPNRLVLMSVRAQIVKPEKLPPYYSSMPTTPIDTVAIAENALGLSPGTCTVVEQTNKFRYIENELHNVTMIRCEQSPLTVTIKNKAEDDGTVKFWIEDLRLYFDHVGQAQGRGIAKGPFSPDNIEILDTLPLKHLKITNESDPTNPIYTDNAASFAVSEDVFPSQLSAGLEGLYTNVSLPLTSKTDANYKFLFNPFQSPEEPTAAINGYYHTTLIHDWLLKRLPPSFQENLNRRLDVKVNKNNKAKNPNGENTLACNAFYDGNSINFYLSGRSDVWDPLTGRFADSHCTNSAFETVIYHEDGHRIDDLAGGLSLTIASRGLSEGWGDLLAALVTGQPKIGAGLSIDYDTSRTADNNYLYPPTGDDESHSLGQAWSGFGWHFRQNLINQFLAQVNPNDAAAKSKATQDAIALAEDRLLNTLIMNPESIPDAAFQVLLLDDNDGDLKNGTPHADAIFNAMEKHTIPLETFVRFTSPLNGSVFVLNDSPVTVKGTIAYTDVKEYQLFLSEYGQNLSWVPIGPVGYNPVEDAIMGSFDPSKLKVGHYLLKLSVTTKGGAHFHNYLMITIYPFRLTRSPEEEFGPKIRKDWVIWTDTPNRLLAKNINNSETKIITENMVRPSETSLDVEYPWVVWANNLNGYTYNLETLEKQFIATDVLEMVLQNQQVFWIKESSFWGDSIWKLDLSNPSAQPIQIFKEGSVGNNFKSQLDTNGDYLVWKEWNWDKLQELRVEDIYILSLSTPNATKKRLTNDGKIKIGLSISDNFISWFTVTVGLTYAYTLNLYNINSDSTTEVLNLNSELHDPGVGVKEPIDMDDDWIVWEEVNGATGYYLSLYDLKNHTITKLFQDSKLSSSNVKKSPGLSGNRLVFIDEGSPQIAEDTDLYLYEIPPTKPPTPFIRGDVNKSGKVDISDPVFLLKILFLGQGQLTCLDSADANDNGTVDISDAIYILQYLFSGGPQPPLPFPSAGEDPTADNLSCK